jgi:D-arginine dehydrogenase
VVGYDPTVAEFFWLAGQGGYGIQSCPALSETAAAMVLDRDIPEAVLKQGLKLPDILPDRYCT